MQHICIPRCSNIATNTAVDLWLISTYLFIYLEVEFLCTHVTLIWMTSGLEVKWQLHWKQVSLGACLDSSPRGWTGGAVWLWVGPIGNFVRKLSSFSDILNFSCEFKKKKKVYNRHHLRTAAKIHDTCSSTEFTQCFKGRQPCCTDVAARFNSFNLIHPTSQHVQSKNICFTWKAMTQGNVQKFLMEVSDMARWYAGTLSFPQLSQSNRVATKKKKKERNQM